MDYSADVRVYCCGLCGAFIYIPFNIAVKFLTEKGGWSACTRQTYYCQSCRNWFEWATEPLLLGDGHAKKI